LTAEPTSPAPQPLTRRPQFRVGAVVAVAVLIALVVWLVVQWSSGDSAPAASAPQRAGAVPVTRAVLGALARSSPIYWAGARPGMTYELTRTADGRIFLRYLPHGVPVGAVEPYLTIGTYPLAGAFAITNTLAARNGAVRVEVPGGGVGFYDAGSPENVYLAFPKTGDQIEVYDPAPGEARRLVASGQIGPVLAAAAATAVASAASVHRLRTLSAALGHPLYWAGPRATGRYELTRAPGGHVFVRYLPRGAAVGTSHPYLTIGTYPIHGAFALTKKLSRDPAAVRVAVGHRGVAFFTRARPTNVYVAYPGTNTQIEVYDPAPGAARRLVGSNRIVPVG